MLPDFLNVKQALSEARSAEVSGNVFGDPVLSKVRSYRQHEGDRFTIFREDGSQATSDQSLIRSEPIILDLKDIQARGEQAIYESIATARQQMSVSGKRLFAEKIEEEPINRMDAGGRRFTAELYLELLETLFVGFDEDGNMNEIDFWQEHPNPQLLANIEAEKKRFDNEPLLRAKLDALISRKRQEWNDREANRKLVD